MQHQHKTRAGRILHSIVHFLHLDGPVTAKNVIAMADDIAAGSKVYGLCAEAIKNETDPVVVVTKVCECMVANQAFLPVDLKGTHLLDTIIAYCQRVVRWDVPAIEAIVRKELGV